MDHRYPPLRAHARPGLAFSRSPRRGKTASSFCQFWPNGLLTLKYVLLKTYHSSVTSLFPANYRCLSPGPAGSQKSALFRVILSLLHDWKLHKTLLAGGMIDTLHRFSIVLRLGPKDIGHKRLWIPIIQGKPARLNLHHDAVARQKYVVGIRQCKPVKQQFIAGNRLGVLQAFSIPTPENIR